MSMELIDGVALFKNEETLKPTSSYEFEPYSVNWSKPNVWDMTGAKLIEHFIAEVSGVKEDIEEGKTIIVSGSISHFDGLCRDIWVGTYQNGKFVKEEHYTVLSDKDGSVYKNYGSGDYNEWYLVSESKR